MKWLYQQLSDGNIPLLRIRSRDISLNRDFSRRLHAFAVQHLAANSKKIKHAHTSKAARQYFQLIDLSIQRQNKSNKDIGKQTLSSQDSLLSQTEKAQMFEAFMEFNSLLTDIDMDWFDDHIYARNIAAKHDDLIIEDPCLSRNEDGTKAIVSVHRISGEQLLNVEIPPIRISGTFPNSEKIEEWLATQMAIEEACRKYRNPLSDYK